METTIKTALALAALLASLALTVPTAPVMAADAPTQPAQPGGQAQPAGKPASVPACAANADALGVSRTVEIDTTGGPGFGFEHYKLYDFLQPHEVVLTFDDGPWPGSTPSVLETLAAQCVKATFFPIGKHALWHPDILKEVAAAGHTIGSHTWSHADVSKGTEETQRDEIEKGVSAVKLALGAPPAPFFRFPYLKGPQTMVDHLGKRNIAIFSTDIDSFDFKIHNPDQLVKSLMGKLEKKGKGILLMHDFQAGTAKALPEILRQLKAKGYKIVHMRPKDLATSIASYDEQVVKELPGASTGTGKPVTSVVKTITAP